MIRKVSCYVQHEYTSLLIILAITSSYQQRIFHFRISLVAYHLTNVIFPLKFNTYVFFLKMSLFWVICWQPFNLNPIEILIFWKFKCHFNFELASACNFIKKETLTKVFSCEFAEFLRTPFLTEHLRWLLLYSASVFYR